MNNISLAANGYYDEFFTMDFLTASAEMSKRQLRKKCSKYGFKLIRNKAGEEGLFECDAGDLMDCLYDEYTTI